MPNKHRVRICKATDMDITTVVTAVIAALFGGKGIDYITALWRKRRTPAEKKTAEYNALKLADDRAAETDTRLAVLEKARNDDAQRIYDLEERARIAERAAKSAGETAEAARADAQKEARHSRQQDEQIAALQLELAAVQKQSADMLMLVSKKASRISMALSKVRKLLLDNGIIGEIADLVGEAASEADELATSLQSRDG